MNRFTFSTLIFFLLISNQTMAQIIWNGTPITFTKENFADWTLPENQDHIMNDIRITRGNSKLIFNYAEDNINASPKNTLWAIGSIADGVENLLFDEWENVIESNPPAMVDTNMVLYLQLEKIYIDITFTSWTSGEEGGGGGFSYNRSTGDLSETYWTGPAISFKKNDYADWTLLENQDRITDNVWITRANQQGLFNIAVEDSYDPFRGYSDYLISTPTGTRWAFGSISDGIENLDFLPWRFAVNSNPPSMVGNPMVLFLEKDSIYIDILFTSWTSGEGEGGGGFSYKRSTGDISDTFWTGSTIDFSKANYADWTLPENQDRITDNVYITRADNQGLFNAAAENEYYVTASVPSKTLWAFGSLAEGIENLKFDYFLTTVDFEPPTVVDTPMVLLLSPYNIYIDITFHSWTSGQEGGGGGFSYTRTTDPFSSINRKMLETDAALIYPNPATAYIKFKPGLSRAPMQFGLYDLNGKKVLSREVNDQEKINLGRLDSGLYFYKLNAIEKTHSGKLFIK